VLADGTVADENPAPPKFLIASTAAKSSLCHDFTPAVPKTATRFSWAGLLLKQGYKVSAVISKVQVKSYLWSTLL